MYVTFKLYHRILQKMAAPFTKRSCFEIDWTLCIIGQRPVIEKSTCQEKLISAVYERAGYGDSFYSDLSRKLEGLRAEDLLDKHVSWHRQCYQSLTSKMNIARARIGLKVKTLQGQARENPWSSLHLQECLGVVQQIHMTKICVSSVKNWVRRNIPYIR